MTMTVEDHTLTLISSGYDDGPAPRRYYRARCICGWSFESEAHGLAGRQLCQIRHGEHLVAVNRDMAVGNG